MNNEIKNFLKSNKNENEYFSLNDIDSISLEKYITFLKSKEQEFNMETENALRKIQEKCNWVKSVRFDGLQNNDEFIIYAVYLDSYDGINVVASFNKESKKFESLSRGYPKFYLLSKKVRIDKERGEDFELIQKELHEIAEIGKKVFDRILVKKSISDIFEIYFSPSYEIAVCNDHDTLAYFYGKDNKYSNSEELNESEKKDILKRVRVKL